MEPKIYIIKTHKFQYFLKFSFNLFVAAIICILITYRLCLKVYQYINSKKPISCDQKVNGQFFV